MIFWKYESPIGLLIPEEDDGGLTALHLPGDQVDALTEKRCCLTPLLKQTEKMNTPLRYMINTETASLNRVT